MFDYVMKPKETKNSMKPAAQNKKQPVQQVNRTGIPLQLKERLERSTGMSLNDVRVHYNSALPSGLDALAYTRGTQVEIGPGQKGCLPHELGHVIQQKLGLVRANAVHSSGAALNTDAGLERQADQIGAGKRINAPASVIGGDVVQRKLFIRKDRGTLQNNAPEMTDPGAEATNQLPTAANSEAEVVAEAEVEVEVEDSDLLRSEQPTEPVKDQKIPRYVGADPGYLEITENMISDLLYGLREWMERTGYAYNKDIYGEKIASMIKKTVKKADPQKEPDPDSDGENNPPQPEKEDLKAVSYYFESLEEFYIYLCLSLEGRTAQKDHTGPNPWLKINMVNTGPGDAIVMTLPAGYLVLDLGTDLSILQDHLDLRKNKRDGSPKGSRGIPLKGAETRILITHDHADHKGNYQGPLKRNADNLLKDVIIGAKDFAQAGYANSPKKQQREEILKLLRSGYFDICDFGGTTKPKSNGDSLVIGRRLGNDEAIVLSGDQTQRRLGAAINYFMGMGGDPDSPVDHLMFKVPHHGSAENNKPKFIDSLKSKARNIDFMLSSGKLYEHPSADMYHSANRLHKQGSFLYNTNTQSSGAADSRTGRILYTANLNKEPNDVAQGSIVDKSNGAFRAVYTKSYADYEGEVQKNAEEKDMYAIRSMVSELIAPGMNKEIDFSGMSVEERMGCLINTADFNIKKQLMQKMDESTINTDLSQYWQVFFAYDNTKFFGWGQDYFYIMAMTCSPEFLYGLFEQAFVQKEFKYSNQILETVIAVGMEPVAFIDRLASYAKNNCKDDALAFQIVFMGIDPGIIFELLYNKSSVEEDIWLKNRYMVLRALDTGRQITYFSYFLTCGSLSYGEVSDVMNELRNDLGDGVLRSFDRSFYFQLIRRYNEDADDIMELYQKVFPNETGKAGGSKVSEDVDFVRMNIDILNENGEGFVLADAEILEEFLQANNLDFPDFLSKLIPQIFQNETCNAALLEYACSSEEYCVEYLAALLGNVYDNDKTGEIFRAYIMELDPSLLVDSWNLLMPQTLKCCFDVSISDDDALFDLLKFILPQIGESDIDTLRTNPTTGMMYEFFMYLIMNRDISEFIAELTDGTFAEVTRFYAVLASIDPQQTQKVLNKHYENVDRSGDQKQEAAPMKQMLGLIRDGIINMLNNGG